MTWSKLPVNLTELCIDTTLRCGQSFRWKQSEDGAMYSCALQGRLLSLKQDDTHLHYRAIWPPGVKRSKLTPKMMLKPDPKIVDMEFDDTESFVRHYLHLQPNLGELYDTWSEVDSNFKKKAPRFTGVRILQQDAWEALVGFICSSNNNIARISQMMDKLCQHYGTLIGHIDSQPFHDMPAPEALTDPKVEGHLRELGFGYRAKYLHQTAIMVSKEDKGWLDSMRNPERPIWKYGVNKSAGLMEPGGREGYRAAHEQLLKLQGVGPKVADCVSLMGLGWGEAVPVDTHVWQIAQRDYKFGKGKHSSLTKDTYNAVANHFRDLWGKEAGWAHSVLFTADLRAFSGRLKAKIESQEDGKVKVKVEVAPALPPKQDGEVEKPVMTTVDMVENVFKSPEELPKAVADGLAAGEEEAEAKATGRPLAGQKRKQPASSSTKTDTAESAPKKPRKPARSNKKKSRPKPKKEWMWVDTKAGKR